MMRLIMILRLFHHRKEKYITLENDTVVPYDYLFIFGGQQYHQPYSLGLCKEVQRCPSNVFVVNRHKDSLSALRKLKKIIHGNKDCK